MSAKRISKEYASITQSPPEGIDVSLPETSTLHTWHITLHGPSQAPHYQPGRFGLLLTMPPDYPFKPPSVRFVTRIYHPNVSNDEKGSVCLAVLKPENWRPTNLIRHVLEAVRQLLIEPNPDDPLEDAIAEEWRRDREAWQEKAKAMVTRYALKDPVFPV